MLKLTLENISKIKLLPDEKLALEKLIQKLESYGYEAYIFGSRLEGYWADIDILINADVPLSTLVKITAYVQKYTETKLDIIPTNEKNSYFVNHLFTNNYQC